MLFKRKSSLCQRKDKHTYTVQFCRFFVTLNALKIHFHICKLCIQRYMLYRLTIGSNRINVTGSSCLMIIVVRKIVNSVTELRGFVIARVPSIYLTALDHICFGIRT